MYTDSSSPSLLPCDPISLLLAPPSLPTALLSTMRPRHLIFEWGRGYQLYRATPHAHGHFVMSKPSPKFATIQDVDIAATQIGILPIPDFTTLSPLSRPRQSHRRETG